MGGAPPSLSKWGCHLQTMYIDSDGVYVRVREFVEHCVLVHTLLELFENLFFLWNRKVGGWCLRKNQYLCLVFVCVVIFCVGKKLLLCNLLCASADALPTNCLCWVFRLAS